MLCKICNTQSYKIFTACLLQKYDVPYFHCKRCGFLQTEEPYWLAEAYAESISTSDTGLLARNVSLSKIVAVLGYFLFDKHGRYLDFAGGYGVLTRLMRDIGFDYYWHDIYTTNIFAQGFEHEQNFSRSYTAITSFECFEHLTDPLREIEAMLALAPTLIFTTDLLPDPVPQPDKWWYYALDQGQHISFYRLKTLEFIAHKYSLFCYSHWGIHMLSKKRVNRLAFNKLIEHHQRLINVVVRRMKKQNHIKEITLNC